MVSSSVPMSRCACRTRAVVTRLPPAARSPAQVAHHAPRRSRRSFQPALRMCPCACCHAQHGVPSQRHCRARQPLRWHQERQAWRRHRGVLRGTGALDVKKLGAAKRDETRRCPPFSTAVVPSSRRARAHSCVDKLTRSWSLDGRHGHEDRTYPATRVVALTARASASAAAAGRCLPSVGRASLHCTVCLPGAMGSSACPCHSSRSPSPPSGRGAAKPFAADGTLYTATRSDTCGRPGTAQACQLEARLGSGAGAPRLRPGPGPG